MPTLTIDGKEITVEDGTTVLQAAEKLGIRIPTMCYLPQRGEKHAACMVCVVRINGNPNLVPSCSRGCEDGMVVESDCEEVRVYRRKILELILSDHIGDCEAPCEGTCPANMEIPEMMRTVADGDLERAIATVKETIALPAVLGRVCPEICENNCRRKQVDQPLAICLVKRYVGDYGEKADIRGTAPLLEKTAPSGKKVAIVGAGPTGLGAAFYLGKDGHEVTVFEKSERLGGSLRDETELLPAEVLDEEIAVVQSYGGTFHTGVELGKDITLEQLRGEFDAVFLAMGKLPTEELERHGLPVNKKGRAEVAIATLATPLEGVFAGGFMFRPKNTTIRMVADGKLGSVAIGQYLRGEPVVGIPKKFNSKTGRLTPIEVQKLVPGWTNEKARHAEPVPPATRFSAPEAVAEATRCLHCDCVAKNDCTLRDLAEEYGAKQNAYAGTRRAIRPIQVAEHLVYEPGKCIACGRCIYLSEAAGEDIGLAFSHRGFDLEVTPSFGRTLSEAVKTVAAECIKHCPTGALSDPTHYGFNIRPDHA